MAINVREARSIIRKAKKRVPEGEDISHINIMPMLDIMTILLVFMIAQASVGATEFMPPDLQAPSSITQDPVPEQATSVYIGREAILVDGVPVVAVRDGDVDSSERAGGALGLEVVKLKNVLAMHRQAFDAEPEKKSELTIIADKSTPYRLLVSVMYSARQTCASEPNCYRKFRLIVERRGS